MNAALWSSAWSAWDDEAELPPAGQSPPHRPHANHRAVVLDRRSTARESAGRTPDSETPSPGRACVLVPGTAGIPLPVARPAYSRSAGPVQRCLCRGEGLIAAAQSPHHRTGGVDDGIGIPDNV